MTEEEKLFLEKKKQLEQIDQEIKNLLKKIEEKKAQKYIRNVRLKQLKYLANNPKNIKKKNEDKKINKTQPKKKQK